MTLNEVRAQIDAIDPKIKELFLERMDASYHVAKVKFEAGETNIFRADREQEIIARLTDGSRAQRGIYGDCAQGDGGVPQVPVWSDVRLGPGAVYAAGGGD